MLNPLNLFAGDSDDKGKDIINESSAAKKMQLLQGYEGMWIQSRRNNWAYAFNKLISITIGIVFAVITIQFKKTTQIFMISETTNNAKVAADQQIFTAYHILTIYWFLFIYFSLAAMDEMIELFSVLNQMEKGALGLFFELNYLIGIFLTVYITWFVHTYDFATITLNAPKDMITSYKHMYNWLCFHYFYLYACILLILIINCIYVSMNKKS